MVPSHEFLPKEDVMKYLHFSLRSSRTLEVHAKFDNVRRDEWQDNEVHGNSCTQAAKHDAVKAPHWLLQLRARRLLNIVVPVTEFSSLVERVEE